ncbi:hypothetical protein [Micromonospora musae]|uniref:hypothetical protein n=1 Tax=Micromonospora musae TaxID=1894970 RepID=UPI0011C44133|nr:hypothetical protein [Micromonospora musae]
MARRDNGAFEHYRTHVNQDPGEREQLYPLLFEVFRFAVHLRFADDAAIEHIREFLNRPRLLLWPDRGFSKAKAEALVRSALGECGLVAGIATGDVVVIRMQVFTYLVEDMQLGDPELDALIAQAEQWVAAPQ